MSESTSIAQAAPDDQIKRENFEREAVPHLDLLYRYGLRLTGDSHRAEDLVQNAMFGAYRSWHQYRMGTNIRAWLMTILRNTFLNEYGKASRAGPHIDIDEVGRAVVLDDGQRSDPESQFFDQIVDDEILRAIDTLPHDFREALVLSDIESLSYAEIAGVTGVPVGTVKSRLFRARRALRRLLHDYCVETGWIKQGGLAAAC